MKMKTKLTAIAATMAFAIVMTISLSATSADAKMIQCRKVGNNTHCMEW